MKDNNRIKLKKDNIWSAIQKETFTEITNEHILTSFLYETILDHKSIEESLSFHLANKINSTVLSALFVRDIMMESFMDDPSIIDKVVNDLQAIYERDPAVSTYFIPFLFFKGFHVLVVYRTAHWLWKKKRYALALCFQSRISEVFSVDIHPAAILGSGILMDHATGVVIGETAVIEDNVSLLHEVTLGGSGKEKGDRHPKVRKGVLIGAGAKVLGNIEIGECSKIGAGSVVLESVPPHSTVVGIPAKVVKTSNDVVFSYEMDHRI